MTIEPPNGFKRPSFSEAKRVELEPGDELYGEIININSGESEFGGWHLMVLESSEHKGPVAYFPKGEAKQAVTQGIVREGDFVWIGVETEHETFTDEDGQEHQYYQHIFAMAQGGVEDVTR